MAIVKVGGIWSKEKPDGTKYFSIGFSPGNEQYPGPSLQELAAHVAKGEGFLAYVNDYFIPGGNLPKFNLCMIQEDQGHNQGPPEGDSQDGLDF